MRIWQKPISVELLTLGTANTADTHLGIEFIEVGDDYIVGRVPVDERTRQPYGLLHGGVSVVLAETLGSCGAAYSCPAGHRAVGLDINANHLKGATSGWVTGSTQPVTASRPRLNTRPRRARSWGSSRRASSGSTLTGRRRSRQR